MEIQGKKMGGWRLEADNRKDQKMRLWDNCCEE